MVGQANLHKALLFFLGKAIFKVLVEAVLRLAFETPKLSAFQDISLILSNEIQAVSFELGEVMSMGK
jgi:hypothetical protein